MLEDNEFDVWTLGEYHSESIIHDAVDHDVLIQSRISAKQQRALKRHNKLLISSARKRNAKAKADAKAKANQEKLARIAKSNQALISCAGVKFIISDDDIAPVKLHAGHASFTI